MAYTEFIKRIGTLVMGRSTYQWLLDHSDVWEYAQPTWVFTHKELKHPTGADIRFVQGDIGAIFPRIQKAAGDKDIWIVGGGVLAVQFAQAGLLDELWVQFAPVTLGSGKPLFPREQQFELLETVRNQDFVCAHFKLAHQRTMH
ncbi:MAG: dihydrofolate reductase family protein [Bifidobacterium aquikefiri]